MSDKHDRDRTGAKDRALDRRRLLLGGTTLAAASALVSGGAPIRTAQAKQQPAPAAPGRRPNILVIFGDDIGQTNVSAYSFGVMGYRTPNIDRIAREGMMFTDYYADRFRSLTLMPARWCGSIARAPKSSTAPGSSLTRSRELNHQKSGTQQSGGEMSAGTSRDRASDRG